MEPVMSARDASDLLTGPRLRAWLEDEGHEPMTTAECRVIARMQSDAAVDRIARGYLNHGVSIMRRWCREHPEARVTPDELLDATRRGVHRAAERFVRSAAKYGFMFPTYMTWWVMRSFDLLEQGIVDVVPSLSTDRLR